MAAALDDDKWTFTGFMPWVTGAKQSQILVTGGVTGEGDQLLALVGTDAPGMTIDAPMQLMALQASETCEVHCRSVVVEKNAILRGPAEDVLASRSPIKPLVVAVTGIGLAGAMIQSIRQHAQREGKMPEDMLEELTARYDALRERLFGFADMLHRPDAEVPKSSLRTGVNDLLARLAAAVLIYAKGSGFLRQLDAQRLAREALFFMVWSAPDDVRANTLAALLDREPTMPRAMPVD
jgi:alkylation response protein AidB-like acyl-CoA dehydrogenase